jgi:hypothetical protein
MYTTEILDSSIFSNNLQKLKVLKREEPIYKFLCFTIFLEYLVGDYCYSLEIVDSIEQKIKLIDESLIYTMYNSRCSKQRGKLPLPSIYNLTKLNTDSASII